MRSKNLKKKKQVEKPVAEVIEKVPDILGEEAMEDSDEENEQEIKVQNKSKKKKKSPQISLKHRAMEDSGDANEQGEKRKTVQKKSKKTDSPQISLKRRAMEDSDDISKQEKKDKQKLEKPDGPQIFLQNRDARDKCSLFIKPIKKEGMTEEIFNLSKDILDVKLKSFHRSTKEVPFLYAYIVFADEATAEKNCKLLQGKKLGDENLVVDFVGEKSRNRKIEKPKAEELDKLRLFVTGFDSRPTLSELRKLFPKSQQIDIPSLKTPRSKTFGFVFIGYADENLATEAFESMQKTSLIVDYAKKPVPKPEKRKAPKQKGSPPKKKVKGKPQPNLDDDEKEDEDSDSEDD